MLHKVMNRRNRAWRDWLQALVSFSEVQGSIFNTLIIDGSVRSDDLLLPL